MGWLVDPIGGSVIVAIDGKAVETMSDLTVYLEMEAPDGQQIDGMLVRNGVQLAFAVVHAARPAEAHKPATGVPARSHAPQALSLYRVTT